MSRILMAVINLSMITLSFAGTPLEGDWTGRIELLQKQLPVSAHFEMKDSALTGSITLPVDRIYEKPLSGITTQPDSVHFELALGDRTMKFQGKLSDRTLRGDFVSGEATGTFEMVRLAVVKPQTYEKYFGIYELDGGRAIYVRTWDELGEKRLTYFDSTGAVRPLFPTSETDFFSGPSLMIPTPVEEEIRFGSKGGKPGLWLKTEKREQFAKQIQPYKEENVTFRNGDVALSGTLVVPTSPGKHPSIVLVHGSSSVTRDFLGPISYHFVREGIAVLSYDKRGVGASTGHWMDADFQALAGDALAGVQLLRSRKEIDSERIGLLGISQGGWISPLAASQSSDVAFLVLISAAAVQPGEQIVMNQEAELRVMQVPEEEIAKGSDTVRSQLAWLRTDEALAELNADLKKKQEEQNPILTSGPDLENPRYLLWLRRVMDYDPLQALKKTRCPVLLVYGELDRTVPFKVNKEGIEQALNQAGNRSVASEVFANANHALLQCNTGSSFEFPHLHEFVPRFFDSVTGWILKQSAKH